MELVDQMSEARGEVAVVVVIRHWLKKGMEPLMNPKTNNEPVLHNWYPNFPR